MESWSYGSEVKSFMLSGELVLNTERNREMLTDWELKNLKTPSAGLENPMLVLGLLDREGLIGKPLHGDHVLEIPGNKAGNARDSSFLVGPSLFSEDLGYGSELLSSVADSNSGESLVDLKLGGLGDCQDGKSGQNLKKNNGLPSMVLNASPLRAKRTRSINFGNFILLCQVHGCNMDLSSSKIYHKRHRVCEVHSKAAKVVVNSLEQRFCQQCSRFHLLAEFDEVKRSCRKRLTGHNERRRKRNLDTHPGKFQRLLLTHHDKKLPATPLFPKTSFICPKIFSSGVLREVKYGNSTGCSAVKVEAELICNGELHIPTTSGLLFPKSSFPIHSLEKPFPSLQEIDSMGRGFYCESSNQNAQTFTDQNPSFFDSLSAINRISEVRDSGCALSLLSCQSQEQPTQSSGLPMVQPLMGYCGPTHYNMGQFSEKLLELTSSSQASTSVGSTRFSSPSMNSVGDDHLGPVFGSDSSDAIDFEVQTDGLFQHSFANAKDEISQKGIYIVDLLQLSSQFQITENQRHSRQEELENGMEDIDAPGELESYMDQRSDSDGKTHKFCSFCGWKIGSVQQFRAHLSGEKGYGRRCTATEGMPRFREHFRKELDAHKIKKNESTSYPLPTRQADKKFEHDLKAATWLITELGELERRWKAIEDAAPYSESDSC